MSDLDPILRRFAAHEGVEHVLLVGRDGLLVRREGGAGALDVDTVAALLPGVAAACEGLADAASLGSFASAVLEMDRGVTIVVSLSRELFLAVFVQPGVGFAPLLREARRERFRLAALL
jgi:predicted regulator of Ras-like GTPase activity (Roadblock/LC7/MglB family)